MNPDYDKKKYYQDSYGNLYPKENNTSICDSCRMKSTCPAKGEKCNNYEQAEEL